MKKYVITAGPGHGKTTIIELLASKGYAVGYEAARLIIEKEQLKKNGCLPSTDLAGFQELVVKRQLELEDTATRMEHAHLVSGEVFFDRGIIDGYGYCKLGKVPAPAIIEEQGRGRYDKVFILDALPGYQNDAVRAESRQTALDIHDAIEQSYREFGYDLIKVPALPPEERVEFILRHVA